MKPMLAPSPNGMPWITVITPVHNGAPYIGECIESVLRQTYDRWRYVIVDNASSDDTWKIASHYAAKDSRIELRRNDVLLDMIDNWNHALSHLDADADFCKILHADDWMFPDCLAEMTALAAAHPSVGIVGAYRLEERKPSLGGLPIGQTVTPGFDICRETFLHKVTVFGSPSNVLMRADLVRKHAPLYEREYLHADRAACLRLLEESDFGFVFKVLTFTRRHNESQTSRSRRLNTHGSEDLLLFKRYARAFFPEREFERLLAHRIAIHYRFLGRAVFEGRGRDFWRYQAAILSRLGSPLSYARLASCALLELARFPAVLKPAVRRRVP